MAYIPKMLEQFTDPAVPDGAGTMSDDWLGTGSGGGGAGGSGAGGDVIAEVDRETEVEPAEPILSYVAVCDHYEHGSQWQGTPRQTVEEAQAEADWHAGKFPGHEVRIVT